MHEENAAVSCITLPSRVSVSRCQNRKLVRDRRALAQGDVRRSSLVVYFLK
jgi:hypothetical protein